MVDAWTNGEGICEKGERFPMIGYLQHWQVAERRELRGIEPEKRMRAFRLGLNHIISNPSHPY